MTQLLFHLWGDYLTQSEWMAQYKTKDIRVALVHALVYGLPFLWLCYVPWSRLQPEHFRWIPWLVIVASHAVIDRFRLARYVIWAKNHLAPRQRWWWLRFDDGFEWWMEPNSKNSHAKRTDIDRHHAESRRVQPWKYCSATGYPKDLDAWLAVWLMIIADNTLHLTINYAALRWL